MKLCFIANGSSIHTRRWVQPMIDRGDQVALVSYTPVAHAIRGCQTVELTRITNVRRIRFIAWGLWIRRFVREYRPAILHAHQIQAAGWLGYLADYHPFVVSAWGSDLLLEPLRSKLRFTLFQRVLDRCDRLIVPAPMMRSRAMELGVPADKLSIIPWGIETDIFDPAPADRSTTREKLDIAQNRPVVFCPRAIQPLYQIHLLLEAVQKIRGHQPEILCILLEYNVDSQYREHLEALAGSYHMEGLVRWLPVQSSLEMARLYRAADVMVSIPASEGFGFTVYEAMASGCPVVTTDLPVFQGELENGANSLLVPSGDPEVISQAILRLTENPALKAQLIRNGMMLVRNKTIDHQVKGALELYTELAGLC